MNSSLQEILELLQDNFPKIKQRILIKIIFMLKWRNNQYKNIGFSRYEASKLWLSQPTLQKIIYFLRDFWILEYKWKVLRTKWDFLCNIYNLSQDFISLFNDLEFFVKKTFQYIDPIVFMKQMFTYTYDKVTKCYKFKVNWYKYLISTRWRFAWKIFWLSENKIINPYSLIT